MGRQRTITWCFLVVAIAGFVLLARVWKNTNVIPGKGYRFHPSYLLLVAICLAYATTILFVRRHNQADVYIFTGLWRSSLLLVSLSPPSDECRYGRCSVFADPFDNKP